MNVNQERGIFVAIHDCGKVVAARVNDPSWDDNEEGIAGFYATQAGRPIQERWLTLLVGDPVLGTWRPSDWKRIEAELRGVA